jgi:predicted dehydrogenase
MNRRSFLKSAGVSAAALNIVPEYVLGSSGQVAPNDKLTVALIGCGTQGLRELAGILAMPNVQVVAVCDPNKDSDGYVDWSRDGLRKSIAQAIGKPDWRAGQAIPGGLDAGAEMVDLYYANQRGAEQFKACSKYADFRELLEKEKGLDAVKIMTPDHLHATVAIAAMKAGKHVLLHKPLANRVKEARQVIETARQTKVATHFIPSGSGADVSISAQLIRDGAIGKLLEIHNWSNRPVWPQYAALPTDAPPTPQGFDWNLWLGPSVDRPYHPTYTHAVFRGWYEFGGGAIADMGHYSLWRVFSEFDLDAPVLVESTPSHVCTLRDKVSVKIKNDYSFPMASTIRFKFAAKGSRAELDLLWYDGGMRPRTPEELEKENAELPAEGMLFVGDRGKILAGFMGEKPRILSGEKKGPLPTAKQPNVDWVKAFKGGEPTSGSFLLAGPISEAFNLGAISLRLGGKRLLWDAANMKITNLPEAEKYLTREYRKGWEI